MSILNVVLSGITSGGPVEYSGASFAPNKYVIYLLPIPTTTTTTTLGPCELICTIDCNAIPDCSDSGGTAETFTTTTTTIAPTTTTTTIAPTTTTTTFTPTTTTTLATTTTTTTAAPIINVYGRLYNYFAISGTGVSSISNTGWHVPTRTEFDNLISYVGGASVAGIALKESGTTHWQSPNSGAANSSGFLALPAGYREYTGTFGSNTTTSFMWSIDTTLDVGNYVNGLALTYFNNFASPYSMNPPSSKNKVGLSIRLIKDDSSWTIGDKYIGNDGQQYDTVMIGTQVWTLQNLKETLYQDHSSIPEVMNNSTWGALTTGARCYYII